jgi:hypothetical protein
MGYGLQIFDASGVEVFGPGHQTVKFLGEATVGSTGVDTATGTITDARFTAYAGHTPFFAEVEGGNGTNLGYAAQWSFSGNDLNWSFPQSTRPKTRIIYGIVGEV